MVLPFLARDPLYVTARGLTTSPIPYDGRAFQIDFDFIDHALLIPTSDGAERRLALELRSVAEFHDELMAALAEVDIRVRIHGRPNEVEKPIPFRDDREHTAYDPDYAQRFWRVLLQADRVFKQFRARFRGKVSPVHFFWGSCDHAVTRFSGRKAPPHPGRIPNLPDAVTREAYSHGWRGMTRAARRAHTTTGSAARWPGVATFPGGRFRNRRDFDWLARSEIRAMEPGDRYLIRCLRSDLGIWPLASGFRRFPYLAREQTSRLPGGGIKTCPAVGTEVDRGAG